MKIKKKNSFILIIVLIFSAILSKYALMLWHRLELDNDISYYQIHFFKTYMYADTLLRFGIKYAANFFKTLQREKRMHYVLSQHLRNELELPITLDYSLTFQSLSSSEIICEVRVTNVSRVCRMRCLITSFSSKGTYEYVCSHGTIEPSL